MLTRPAKLLPIHFTLGTPLAADVDGKTYRFTGSLLMYNPQIHSDINLDGHYDLTDLNVGDYIATEPAGRVMRVVAISSQTVNTASITVEDEFRMNQQQDSTGNAEASVASNTGVAFEVVEGRPILFPYGDQSTEVVGFIKDYASEIQSRFDYLKQDTVITTEQSHSFVVGDLITYRDSTSTYELMDAQDLWIGVVVEVDNPTTGTFRWKPSGRLIDIAITGTGPYFWWDTSSPGKIIETEPASGMRNLPAFFKLSPSQSIQLSGGIRPISGEYVTIDTAEDITGEKTFTAVTHFDNTVEILAGTSSSSTTTGALTVTGGVGIGENLNVGGDMVLTGDLTISGTATIINTNNLSVTDKLIELASGTTGAPIGDSGVVIERGDENNIFIGWDESADVVTFGTGTFTGSTTGNLTTTDANIRIASSEATAGYTVISNTNAPEVNNTVYVLYNETTNATQTELFLDGSSTQVTLPDNTTMMFEATIVGRDSTGAKHVSIKVEGVADRTSNTTVLVTTTSQTTYAQANNTWSVDVTADDTNDTIAVKVTGGSSDTVKWTAFVKTISINH